MILTTTFCSGQIITTVAGNGTGGFSGDAGPATSAQLWSPTGIAVDSAGSLYVADANNNRIRKVSPSGIITTLAGNGVSDYSGDGGPATVAALGYPSGIAVDAGGNLYVADTGNNRVRKVSSNGTITTFAGNGTDGYYLNAGGFPIGDGSSAVNAAISRPAAVALDAGGNLYIADTWTHRIRKVSSSGIITTVAGNGADDRYTESGPATSVSLSIPAGVTVDTSGNNIYIADTGHNRICKVSSFGMLSTVAGNGTYGFSGDGGPATNAELQSPTAVAFDAADPLSRYPVIAEFRSLLAAFPPKARPPQHWDGEHFFGYLSERDKETEFWFRAHRNGITFGFSSDEWKAVRELFRQAWEVPEIRVTWDALTLEYGEL